MIDCRTAPYAALVLRVSLGILFLAHASLKIFVFTPAGTAQFFGSLGLPPALAYVTIAVEVVGGGALILGFLSRVAHSRSFPFSSARSSRCTAQRGSFSAIRTAAGNFPLCGLWGWSWSHCWVTAPMRSVRRRLRKQRCSNPEWL